MDSYICRALPYYPCVVCVESLRIALAGGGFWLLFFWGARWRLLRIYWLLFLSHPYGWVMTFFLTYAIAHNLIEEGWRVGQCLWDGWSVWQMDGCVFRADGWVIQRQV